MLIKDASPGLQLERTDFIVGQVDSFQNVVPLHENRQQIQGFLCELISRQVEDFCVVVVDKITQEDSHSLIIDPVLHQLHHAILQFLPPDVLTDINHQLIIYWGIY